MSMSTHSALNSICQVDRNNCVTNIETNETNCDAYISVVWGADWNKRPERLCPLRSATWMFHKVRKRREASAHLTRGEIAETPQHGRGHFVLCSSMTSKSNSVGCPHASPGSSTSGRRDSKFRRTCSNKNIVRYCGPWWTLNSLVKNVTLNQL